MPNSKFFILAIFLVGLLSFSAVSAADNATGEIVSTKEAPVMEQITAEEIGCEGNVATLHELQNNTLNSDSTLKSDEDSDSDFIAIQNEDSDNLLTDGSSTVQSTHDLYGIVDLGSNVMSLSIIEEENGKLEFILSDNRESITATYKEDNALTQEGIDRLILLLNDFDGIMDSNNVTVKYFFATASLRKLDNCGEVFAAVKNTLGIDLQILSEKDEAQAGFDAVRFVDLTDDDGILIDIGGGSCEVVAFRDRNPLSMESMPIGSRSCYEDYVSSTFPNETEILNIQNRVEVELGNLHANNSAPVDDLYGIGGTLFYVRQTLIYLDYIDNETYVIPLSTLDALLARLLENTTESYRIISDVAPDRINTLIPGIVMARQISNHFQIKNIHFCKSRIEEGIVYELIYNYTLSYGTFKELQDEIDAAVEGSTIYLRKDYVNDGNFSSEGINITKAITIEGNGFAIDATCFSRIFNIDAAKNVVLNNIIFKNGLADYGGAIIFNNNISDCIISNCGFLANNANGDGGAVYFRALANVTIENTIFNFNIAAGNGGAIYFLNNSDSDIFRNTLFLNNVAELGDGGAINFFKNLINAVFDNVTFMSNFGRNGGAINVDGSTESTLFNCTSFISNTARRNGGAIYVLRNLNSIVCKDTSFISNVASEDGGAINVYWDLTNGVFDNCIFEHNNGRNGGAVNIDQNSEKNLFNNTPFISNTAKLNGGALYILYASDSDIFKNVSFTDNVALNEDGGAINFHRTLINGTFDNVTFMNNSGRNGGAINVDSNTESNSFNHVSFIGNIASKSGGVLFVLRESDTDSYENSLFIDNSAKMKGGAISYNRAVMNGLFDNVTFEDNHANNGGAIYVNADVENTTIANSEFKGNTADSGTNNVALNGEGTFKLDNVIPENLGPTYLALLTVINVTDNVAYGGNVEITVNVTDKFHEPLKGTVSVMINGENHTANVENGRGKIILSGLNAGKYGLNVTYSGLNYTAVSPVSFNVLKQNAAIVAASKAYIINYDGKYGITLKDADGKVLTSKKVIFTLNGKIIGSATTNSQGVATISLAAKILKAAKAGRKNLVIEFADSNYNPVSKTVKITINKEKTKLSAKSKKFKKATKVKKYTISLKNSKGKGIKKVKVTLKVKGKKYTVKTNSKGKATFKIKNLKKKGKFATTIAFKGNAYYNKVTKKVKITVK